KFYPVNMPSLKKRLNLFVENERVVLLCETTEKKRFYMVLVSALNVGVMQVSFEPKIKTNADALRSSAYSYDNIYLKKGDDFGCFEMGSTIVILAQKDMLDIHVSAGEHVKYGDTIAELK
ncbi:MAG: phosphatidylserine decarboxylase, partial [Campylobacterota bacterium]|nr:phosphatidylserine decarboxylase [Campylobacterota bacterium]